MMKNVLFTLILFRLFSLTGFSQTGSVASFEKVSHLHGNLGLSLPNQGFFGYLTETSTPGTLISGAPFDGHGAIYFITLSDIGDVASAHRFSPTDPSLFDDQLTPRFGTSSLDLGDRSGDGMPDYLIGAPGVQPFGKLIYMESQGNDFQYTALDFPPEFQEPGAIIGEFIAADDGLILIPSASGSGRIYRVSLTSENTIEVVETIDQSHPLLASKLESGDRFGTGVSTADMNGDGIVDLLCGAIGDDDQGSNYGAVYVLLRDASMAIVEVRKYSRLEGDFGGFLNSEDHFGLSVRAIGDLDQNGTVDLAVGAPGDDDGGIDIGAIWILFMREDGTIRDERKINRLEGNFAGDINFQDRFGTRIAALGDYNGDGTIDLAVGAVEDDDGGVNRGAFYSIFIEHCPAPSGAFLYSINESTVSFTAEGGESYSHLWNFDDGGFSQVQNPVHTYQNTGNYWVCLAINSDCGGDNYCQNVLITVLSVEDKRANLIKLFPNPSSGNVQVSCPLDVETIGFYDITGKELLRYQVSSVLSTFDTSVLSQGMYLVEFSGKGFSLVKKWTKL